MPRRKSTFKRFEFVRVYFVPAGGLLLWLGICAVGLLSLGNMSSQPPLSNQSQTPLTQDRQQNAERTSSTTSQASPDDKNDREVAQQNRVPEPKPSASRENTSPAPDTKARVTSLDQLRLAAKSDEDDAPPQQDVAATQTSEPPDEKPETATNDTKQAPAASTPAADPTTSANVSRAQLTSGIENREPIDRITGAFYTENKPLRRLYYFTEIKDLRGQTVTHNWWHEGRLIATVKFPIGGNSWRVYSSKKLIPSMIGPWRVVVTDSQGKTLSVARFVYKAS